MNARTKNLAMAAGAVVVAGFVGVNVLLTPEAAPAGSTPAPVSSAAAPSPSATSTAPAGSVVARRSYAVGLQDLAGLPPDAAPGQRLELWVTWEPPVTDEARLHKLIADVVLERIVPGSVPEAPVTVLLSVPEDRTADLIYADTYGKLSAVLP